MKNPKFILSKKKVFEKFDEMKKISDFVSYSSKTNPEVTKILEKGRECFFSVHLINELKNISNWKRIIFLVQGWDEKKINYLINKGIKNFVVDNEGDLKILEKFLFRKNKIKINLFLRLKLKENTLRTEKYFVFGFNSKFINLKISKLKKIPQIKKLGIHFHRKTQNISEWNLKEEIENTLSKEVLKNIDFLIIGGGLPAVYANTNVKIFNPIFKKILEFKNWLNSEGIKMIIEPGRYIAAPSVKLVTKILRIYKKNIILNASVYNSDLDALIVPVKLLVEGEVSKSEGVPYVIKGNTPCSMDLFRYRVYFNKELKEGDEIIFLNAGAYNFYSNFCDLEKIKYQIVEDF